MLPMWLFSFFAYIYQPQTEPRVALVFGAGVFCKESSFSFKDESISQSQKNLSSQNLQNPPINYDCSPSTVLEQRLNAAIDLWKNGKIDKIIVSGDNRSSDYNEPFGMFRYLKDAGVPTNIIVQDFAGFSTVDTCYRAKRVFFANSVYVVTQPFHIPRATALCQSFGLQVRPVPAFNTQYFQTSLYGFLREIPASWNAL